MSEIAIEAASTKTKLLEIAKQAAVLSAGLQNAAPGERETPNASIQYLTAIADLLAEIADNCDEVTHPAATTPPDASSGHSGM